MSFGQMLAQGECTLQQFARANVSRNTNMQIRMQHTNTNPISTLQSAQRTNRNTLKLHVTQAHVEVHEWLAVKSGRIIPFVFLVCLRKMFFSLGEKPTLNNHQCYNVKCQIPMPMSFSVNHLPTSIQFLLMM